MDTGKSKATAKQQLSYAWGPDGQETTLISVYLSTYL